MALRWERDHLDGDSATGYDGAYLVAQVVRYDTDEAWHAFLSGHRVDGGTWATIDEAQQAAEAAYRVRRAAGRGR